MPARRYFHDELLANGSPLAREATLRMQPLFAIETEIHGQPPAARLAARQARSAPIMADLHAWLEATLRRITGTRPRDWLGPALQETLQTPERLVAAGYDYVCDWVLDDQPVRLATRNGSIASVPYTQEINDVPMILIRQHPARE